MRIVKTVGEMQRLSKKWHRDGLSIGFVPTMGYLHEGHLSLVGLAGQHSDKVVISIFVNPKQFGPNEDLDNYPRNFERDEALCHEAGVDVVFYPKTDEMYASDTSVFVDENSLSKGLCGASREGHFRGVLTVVAKLFNIVLPDVAVFGRKDAQQLRLIEKMVEDLNFPVDIVGGDIVREADGLAMSSRNTYLSAKQRRDALCLQQALGQAEKMIAKGVFDAFSVRMGMLAVLEQIDDVHTDYVEIVDWSTLKPVERLREEVLIALAVYVGHTRLIDNVLVKVEKT